MSVSDGHNIVTGAGGVECYWGAAKSEIDFFVKEVIHDVTTIHKCLSGEETSEDVATQPNTTTATPHPNNNKIHSSSTQNSHSHHHHLPDHRSYPDDNYREEIHRPTVASVKERLVQLRSSTDADTSRAAVSSNSPPPPVATVSVRRNAAASTPPPRPPPRAMKLPAASEEMIDACPNEEDEEDKYDDEDDEEEEELSWRMHPLKSMSDWTIQVVVTQGGRKSTTIDTYHVHKSVLAVGPRRSNYFRNLFREHHHIVQQQQQQLENMSASNVKNTNTTTRSGTKWQLPDIPSATTILGLPAAAAHPSYPPPPEKNTTSSHSNAGTNNVTRLELPALAASAFPYLLDFLYDVNGCATTGQPQQQSQQQQQQQYPSNNSSNCCFLTTHNATALHVLAEKLDMKVLRIKVRDFWMSDIALHNIAVYYQHATCLNDVLIVRALEMYTAQHLFDDDSTTGTGTGGTTTTSRCTIADIFDVLDAQFILNVITMAANDVVAPSDRHAFSLRLSLLVAVYCHQHQQAGDLDPDMFDQLTDARHLPTLEAPAAKAFLELLEALHGAPQTERITSLTERCIAVLSDHWDDTCIMTEEELSGGRGLQRKVNLPRLVGPAMEAFTSKALVNAKQRLDRLEAEKIEVQSRNETLERRNDDLQKENESLYRQLRDLHHQRSQPDGVLVCHGSELNGTDHGTNSIVEKSALSRPSISSSDRNNALPYPSDASPHEQQHRTRNDETWNSYDGDMGSRPLGQQHRRHPSSHDVQRGK